MQPPPNDHPFHQYLRKITAQTQLRPPATASTATESANPNPNSPPPRYTPATVSHDFEDDYDEDYEDFDEYDDSYDFDNAPNYYPAQGTGTGTAINSNDPNTNLKTLTINLDSSITITGDGNTVGIPSDQSQAQAQSKTQPNAPKSKLANTASAIIAALQQSGVSASASVEINIDAGVRVGGSRNIVCFGGMIVPGQVPVRAGAGAAAAADVKTMNAQPNARKRRAQSEPAADTTEMKRSKN
ncbi:hypothetical protein BDV19DRAFT_393890 [Aspergillus venezuelensis]